MAHTTSTGATAGTLSTALGGTGTGNIFTGLFGGGSQASGGGGGGAAAAGLEDEDGFDLELFSAILGGLDLLNRLGAVPGQESIDRDLFESRSRNFQGAIRTLQQQITSIRESPALAQLRQRGLDFLDPRTTNIERQARTGQLGRARARASERATAGAAARGVSTSGAAERAQEGIEQSFNQALLNLASEQEQRGEQLLGTAFQAEQRALAPLLQQLAALQPQAPVFQRQARGPLETGAGIGATAGGLIGAFTPVGPLGGAAIGGALGGLFG